MQQKKKIIAKINRSKKGTIFLPDSFSPIDTHYAANILAEMCEAGILAKVAFGIYIKPKMSSFGPVMPTLQEIALVIAKRDSAQILPAGPTAENYLGFSTQIPTNAVYLTSGTPRIIKVGNRKLTLKRSVPSTFAYKGKIMPILVLALKSIGQKNVTSETIEILDSILKKYPEEKTWLTDVVLAPRWIRMLITNSKKNKKIEQMA